MSARDRYPMSRTQSTAVRYTLDPAAWKDMCDEIDRLRASILDIDAHATPMGVLREDDPEGSPAYYYLTVGALHRALAATGAAAKCADLPCPRSAWLMESASAMRAAIERLAGYLASGGDSEPSYTEFLESVMRSATEFDTVVREWTVTA